MKERRGRPEEGLLEASLSELYEDAPCGYLFTRPDGTVARVNQTFLTWTGYTREELLAPVRFQDLLTVPGRIFYENQYAPLLRLRGSVREVAFDLVRRGRAPLPVLVNAVQQVDANGQPALVASIIFDATERRAYERELLLARRQAEELAAVVTTAGDAIVRTTPAGVVRTWNAGAERLFGQPARGSIGRNLREFLPPAGAPAELARIADELRAGRPGDRRLGRADPPPRRARRARGGLGDHPRHRRAPRPRAPAAGIPRDGQPRAAEPAGDDPG